MEIIERNEQNEEIAVPSLENADAKEIARRCVAILDEKKAHDIRLLRVEDQTVLANYFVICTGTSNTQLRALAGELEYKLGLAKQPPLRIEGYDEASWIILDFGCVMVHIFNRTARDFYQLEKLWAESEPVDISALIQD